MPNLHDVRNINGYGAINVRQSMRISSREPIDEFRLDAFVKNRIAIVYFLCDLAKVLQSSITRRKHYCDNVTSVFIKDIRNMVQKMPVQTVYTLVRTSHA
jgi:hypothetical protein